MKANGILPQGSPLQWLRLILVVMAGFTGFFLVAGETDDPSSLAHVIGLKVLGVAILAAACLTGAWLNEKGLLPDEEEDAA